MMERHFKFRHVNELTGLFVLSVLALIFICLVLSAGSQRWFSRTCAFDVLLPEKGSFGIKRGSEIFILGVSAGSIYGIDVGVNGRIRAHAKVRSDFERFVRVDSVATLKKVFGVAGDSFMEISRGTGDRLPDQNSAIICKSEEELPELMASVINEMRGEILPVVKKADAALEVWTDLAKKMTQTQGQMDQLVTRLNDMVAGIEQGKGTAGQLIKDAALMDDVGSLLAKANATLSQVQGVVTNADNLVHVLHSSAAPLPQITGTLASEAKDLPGLVLQTQQSMREMERLVEAMQRSWLVRSYLNKTNPPPIRILPLPKATNQTTNVP